MSLELKFHKRVVIRRGFVKRMNVVIVSVMLSIAGAIVLFTKVVHPVSSIPKMALILCSSAGSDLTVTSSTQLDPNCTYTGHFNITASNVFFDCRGAMIDGVGKSGIGIEVSAPANADLSNVTIDNCIVKGFTNGMRITRVGFRSLQAGAEYVNGISGVLIENSKIIDSSGAGLYIDAYVTHTTVNKVSLLGDGSTGMYLEAGSMDNVVENSVFLDNGYVSNGPYWQAVPGLNNVWWWGTGREGLAIDGSRNNIIKGNKFQGNSAGGIFLYKNCGEDVNSQPQSWFPRRYDSSNNLIENNTFTGGVDGVWIGSRMSQDVEPLDCSESSYISGKLFDIKLDHAPNNTVLNNTFYDVTYGVRIEDNGTRVIGNKFYGGSNANYAVVVGTRYRTSMLSEPVSGTSIIDNISNIPNPSPYRWIYGQVDSKFQNNSSLNLFANWCPGKDLPLDPLLFVEAVRAGASGGGVPPPPNPTPAVVGTQTPCS